MSQKERAPTREIFGWAMFDFANSSYTTVIITVVYSVIFTNIIVGDAPDYKLGNLLWSMALIMSYGIVVITAPIFGAIMDYSATKKKFLFASYVITIVFTALLYFVSPGLIILGVILVALSNFGFAVGESFVSSFLPDLGPPEELGKISGYAWGLGYFGGLASTVLVILLGPSTLENFSNLRFVGPITAVFFLVAAIPTFLFVKERGVAQKLPPGESYFSIGFKRLAQTFREIRDFKDLLIFLTAFFFAYSGLAIVISFAFIYGDQVIHWSPTSKVIMFVVTQFTAAGGAVLFGFIQDRIGTIKTFNITLVIWVIAVTLIFGANEFTDFLNRTFGTSWPSEHVFLFIGCLAGLCLGATQSASRALVGIFSPESKSGEFFGFWGLFGKTSSIFGLGALGVMQTQLGLKNSILVCSLFFLIAFFITLFVNEKRGREMAASHEGE